MSNPRLTSESPLSTRRAKTVPFLYNLVWTADVEKLWISCESRAAVAEFSLVHVARQVHLEGWSFLQPEGFGFRWNVRCVPKGI